MFRPIHQSAIFWADIAAAIDQEKDEPQSWAMVDVGVDRLGPFFHLAARRFGKTVAGKIDEDKRFIDEEKIEQPSFARSSRGFSQFF